MHIRWGIKGKKIFTEIHLKDLEFFLLMIKKEFIKKIREEKSKALKRERSEIKLCNFRKNKKYSQIGHFK